MVRNPLLAAVVLVLGLLAAACGDPVSERTTGAEQATPTPTTESVVSATTPADDPSPSATSDDPVDDMGDDMGEDMTASPAASEAAQTAMAGHAHGVVEAAGPMSVALEVAEDAVGGWNVHIVPEGFEFAPELASTAHVDGVGHAHLYIDGEKIGRVYGDWLHVPPLPEGEHEIEVRLSSNDHADYAVAGTLVSATATVVGEDGATATGPSATEPSATGPSATEGSGHDH